jgi:broad specificity phosphatase PhoE
LQWFIIIPDKDIYKIFINNYNNRKKAIERKQMKNNIQKLIFLIRHGNTEFNEKNTFRGHFDISLDSTGMKQAEKTGKFLKDINFGVIYSSPLSRAYKTAEMIKKYQKSDTPIIKEDGFKDLNFGKWQGMGYNEAGKQYPEIFNHWVREPFKAVIPGGEMLGDAQKRSWETLKEIISKSNASIIAIVTHRVINLLLITKILNTGESNIWQINQDPCCINVFEYKYENLFISKLNYNSHITDFKESFLKKE